MRTPGLAAITMAFAIAACSEPAAPIAAGPDASAPQAAANRSPWGFLSNSGHKVADNKGKCDVKDRRLFIRRGWRRFDRHHWGAFGRHDNDQDCSTGGDSTPAATAQISGTVMNESVAAAGYPVFLLKGDGSAVVSTTTTDVTGAYSFAAVAAGAYLVCEDNPFTEARGYLGETRPQTGGTCPGGAYASVGFSLTVAAGATLTGNNFNNMGLD
jgi:hypothetical protein